jgi:hypothetical protein
MMANNNAGGNGGTFPFPPFNGQIGGGLATTQSAPIPPQSHPPHLLCSNSINIHHHYHHPASAAALQFAAASTAALSSACSPDPQSAIAIFNDVSIFAYFNQKFNFFFSPYPTDVLLPIALHWHFSHRLLMAPSMAEIYC